MSKEELLAKIDEIRAMENKERSAISKTGFDLHKGRLAIELLPHLRAALADAPDEGECAKALREAKQALIDYQWSTDDTSSPWEHKELMSRIDTALASRKPAPSEAACVCAFGRVIDCKITADERATSYHVWKYNAEQMAAHLIAIVGLDVVKRAHGCGEGHERNAWLDTLVTRSEPYKNTLWCMPPSESAMRKALRECVEAAYIQGHNDTVESRYGDPVEVANDLINEALARAASGEGQA